jgi:DNA-binding response OmpR family regulator
MACAAYKECAPSETSSRTAVPAENSQTTVLLIEDNEEAMFLVRIALQEHGKGVYHLEWANGLSAGLERLEKGGVDLVLLDLGLPESSGPASYAWVHEIAPDIPILVLTGDTREETEFAIAASGVEDFLIKDEVSGALLLQAIRAALHTSKRSDSRRMKLVKGNDEPARPKKVRAFMAASPDSRN